MPGGGLRRQKCRGGAVDGAVDGAASVGERGVTGGRRLRIGYLCDHDPRDPGPYSGGNTRIYEALATHAGDVTPLSRHWFAAEPVRRVFEALPDAITLRARWRAQLALSRVISRGLSRHVAAGDFDVIFGAYSFHSLARLRLPPRVVLAYTSDATPTTYRESEIGRAFGSYLGASRALDGWVLRHEARVFGAADLLLWPSDWLNAAATARYGLDPARCHTVPWGANIPAWPAPPGPRPFGRAKPLNLLVVGRDWFAKGGPLAFDTMQALRAEGVDARLTVIGTTPPDFHLSDHVTVHPYLDKSDPDQFATFEAALRGAHFMVQPSFESYGFAFCEASAYGLPSLCLRVGGVPVREGVNGHALPPGATPDDFAGLIGRYLDDPDAYHALTESSRAEFEARLNWDAWGARVADMLQAAVAARQTGSQ